MSVLFRVQENTPDVYYEESRDFQLLGRLYDCVINGLKYDIDSVEYLIDTKNCKSKILQLLETKLGFFTNQTYNDNDLRYILRAFATMVKNKGSVLAIQQAINVFLKLNHITSAIKIWYISNSTVVYGTQVPDHTIVVGLTSQIDNWSLLLDVLRYLLPTGFGFYFYFYSDLSTQDTLALDDNAHLIFVSDNLNSQVRGSDYTDDYENRLLGAVDTMYVASDDSIIPTSDGTYKVSLTNKSLFLGVLDSLPQTNINQGNYVVVDHKAYYYDSSGWKQINFKGIKDSLPTSGRQKYDVVGIRSKNLYYWRNNNSWKILNFRGTTSNPEKLVEQNYLDCVKVDDSTYKVCLSTNNWQSINDIVYEKNIDKVTTTTDNTLAIIDGVTYYMFTTKWVDNTLAIYLLNNSNITG